MLNECSFIGYVGKEPDCTVTSDGKELAKFNLAVSRDYDREKTDWINCVIFGSAVTRFIKPFVHKGDLVFVRGALSFSSYVAKDNTSRTSSSVMLDKIYLLNSKTNEVEKGFEVEKDSASQVNDDGTLPY